MENGNNQVLHVERNTEVATSQRRNDELTLLSSKITTSSVEVCFTTDCDLAFMFKFGVALKPDQFFSWRKGVCM